MGYVPRVFRLLEWVGGAKSGGMPAPIAVLSFNRPALLRRFLCSLRDQTKPPSPESIALFQDGGSEQAEACCTIFRELFPRGSVFRSPDNIGIALNFNRAERYIFEVLRADAGLLFEDDLILGPHYLETMDQLVDLALTEPRIARVSAAGQHNAPMAEQARRQHEIVHMNHQWGYAITRRHWEAERAVMDRYLEFVRGRIYRNRDHSAIHNYFHGLGYSIDGTSQDAAKFVASCAVGSVNLMTFACLAKYEGREGEHFFPEFYDRNGYGNTEMLQHAPVLNLPSSDRLDGLVAEAQSVGRTIRRRQLLAVMAGNS